MSNNRVCLCIECGSFWKTASNGWERLLPSDDKGELQENKILSSSNKNTATLRLAKDFKNYQFLYYWFDGQANKISPDMTTFHHAEEWIIDYHFSLYNGTERRKSKIDRRTVNSSRQSKRKAIFFSKRERGLHGRRITDRQVHVDIDLSIEKLELLKQAIKQRSSVSNSG